MAGINALQKAGTDRFLRSRLVVDDPFHQASTRPATIGSGGCSGFHTDSDRQGSSISLSTDDVPQAAPVTAGISTRFSHGLVKAGVVSGEANPLEFGKGSADDSLRFLLNPPKMLVSFKALGVNLVDLFGA